MTWTVYKPAVVYASATDQSINSGVTLTLLDQSFKGQLDEIFIRVQDKNMSVILEIDGDQVYDFNLDNLKNDYNLSDNTALGLKLSNDGKMFYDTYNNPIMIDSNLTVKVRNDNSKTKKVYSYIIRVRDYQGN